MNYQVRLHGFLPESKHVRIARVDGRAYPMSVGMAECSYSGEVFDDALALPADERFVDAEDVRIPVDVDDWLAECESFLFERGDEGDVSRFSPAAWRYFDVCTPRIPLPPC